MPDIFGSFRVDSLNSVLVLPVSCDHRVGIEVVEGLWLGEQRGRQNSLKLLLDAGQHSLRVRLEIEATSNRALRDGILSGAQVRISNDAAWPDITLPSMRKNDVFD